MITKDDKALLEQYANIDLFSSTQINGVEIPKRDSCGNLHFVKKGPGKKIQIVFQTTPVGILPNKEKEDGYSITVLGGEKKKYLADSVVYLKETPIGVLRSNEDDLISKRFTEIEELPNEILTIENRIYCKASKLYACNLDSILSLYFLNFIRKNDFFVDKFIDFTVWNSSLNGENGLVSAIQYANADTVLYISLIQECEECHQGKGPAYVIKDGNYVCPLAQKNHALEFITQEKLEMQFYVGKNNSALEQLDIHIGGKPLLGLYLPIKYQNTQLEEIFWSDVEKTRNVLLKYDHMM